MHARRLIKVHFLATRRSGRAILKVRVNRSGGFASWHERLAGRIGLQRAFGALGKWLADVGRFIEWRLLVAVGCIAWLAAKHARTGLVAANHSLVSVWRHLLETGCPLCVRDLQSRHL